MYEWEMKSKAIENLIALSSYFKDKKTVHVYGSFGDIYFQSAIVSEYNAGVEKQERYEIIIDEKYKEFAEKIFSNGELLYFVDSNMIHKILSDNGVIGDIKGMPIRLLSTIYPVITELIYKSKLDYVDFTRTIIKSLKVGPITKIENKVEFKNEAEKILIEANLPFKNTVLLNCENNTHKEFSENFWIQIINIVLECGKTPCLNISGTLRGENTKLNSINIAKIKVPPYLAVSVVEACGYYIAGSNGFLAIQGFFNDKSDGIHLVNADNGLNIIMQDNFGNEVEPSLLTLEMNSPKHYLNRINEIQIAHQKLTKENIEDIKHTLRK